MTVHEPAEVPEADARGTVAESYAAVRRSLGSSFVPTVYRRLATHPAALSTAAAALPGIVDVARATGFADEVTRSAAALVRPARMSAAPTPSGAGDVIARYRQANPLNLLFAVSLFHSTGSGATELTAVMEPPLPPRAPDEDDDIRACHGGDVLPGLWRELGEWPAWRSQAWSALREDTDAGGLVHARVAVTSAALDLVGRMAIDTARREVASLLPAAAALELRRFPAVIASMVVEAEWLVRAMNPHTEE